MDVAITAVLEQGEIILVIAIEGNEALPPDEKDNKKPVHCCNCDLKRKELCVIIEAGRSNPSAALVIGSYVDCCCDGTMKPPQCRPLVIRHTQIRCLIYHITHILVDYSIHMHGAQSLLVPDL